MISVIIPTLDAAAHLPHALAPLVEATARGLVKQVIVSDGGSSDDTLAIAEAAGCDIVSGEAGRARQLRAGAVASKGKWLLFLHADTVLADGWVAETERFVNSARGHYRAAAYKLAFDDDSSGARSVLFWARLRSRWLKLPYGDQGLLISRFLYDALGGYADIPIMEDVELVRRIGARRLTVFQTEAMTSAEKFRRDGFSRRAWRNIFFTARYLMGADPAALAKAYD